MENRHFHTESLNASAYQQQGLTDGYQLVPHATFLGSDDEHTFVT